METKTITSGTQGMRYGLLIYASLVVFAQGAIAQKNKAVNDESNHIPSTVVLKTALNQKADFFTLTNNHQTVALKWSLLKNSLTEDGFWIERSNDGIHFDVIGVSETGEVKNDAVTFSYIDKFPISKLSYYRILCLENNEIKILCPAKEILPANSYKDDIVIK